MKLNQVVDRVPRCVVQRELIRMWSREPRLDLDPNKIMGLRYPSVTKSLPIAEGSRTSLEPRSQTSSLSGTNGPTAGPVQGLQNLNLTTGST